MFLVFDMDGTIANLCAVDNWEYELRHNNVRPYVEAEPMYDMDELCAILETLKAFGFVVVVTTWLSRDADRAYKDATRQAKKEWLDRYGFPYDELHMVAYGTTKANATRHHKEPQILFDDNAKIRKGWHLGETVDASTENILNYLEKLLDTVIK